MHRVLLRTRPASDLSPRPASKLRALLRSFLAGKRGLVLLAICGGAALSSQALHGLWHPRYQPAPGTPAGADGRGESAATTEPATEIPATREAGKDAAARSPAALVAEPGSASSPVRSQRPLQRAPLAALSAVLRSGRRGAPAPATASPSSSLSAQPLRGQEPPLRSGQAADPGPGVIADPWPDVLPSALPADAVQGPAERRQLDTVTRADLDPPLGIPCSDSTASLPSAMPPEEAWLPGIDASSAFQAAALEPILKPPIDSEWPDRATGPSLHAFQATRNTPCLLKLPAGQN